ncbi:hypothetical protein EKD04_005615 [Chloroflexales bacterium ZM16-3]|nr:hypothetical protein [Chloroflexales bacterium ZM16-3]
MADTQNSGNTAPKGEDLAEAVVAMSNSMARVGVMVATLPLAVLPPKAREDATAVANDLFNSVGSLHLSIAKTAIRGLSAVTSELTKAAQPMLGAANKALNEVSASAKR